MSLSTHIRERISASGPIEKNKLLMRSADEIDRLRDWIKWAGENTDTCTKNILGDVCEGCACGKELKK